MAGFHDPNPCLVFEHKLLYWSHSGNIDFDGDLAAIWRPRRYIEGSELTLVASGAMVYGDRWPPDAPGPIGRGVEPAGAATAGPRADHESIRKTGRLLVVQSRAKRKG